MINAILLSTENRVSFSNVIYPIDTLIQKGIIVGAICRSSKVFSEDYKK